MRRERIERERVGSIIYICDSWVVGTNSYMMGLTWEWRKWVHDDISKKANKEKRGRKPTRPPLKKKKNSVITR